MDAAVAADPDRYEKVIADNESNLPRQVTGRPAAAHVDGAPPAPYHRTEKGSSVAGE
jgi:hypothetical protein